LQTLWRPRPLPCSFFVQVAATIAIEPDALEAAR
jgi:hypothetical protein